MKEIIIKKRSTDERVTAFVMLMGKDVMFAIPSSNWSAMIQIADEDSMYEALLNIVPFDNQFDQMTFATGLAYYASIGEQNLETWIRDHIAVRPALSFAILTEVERLSDDREERALLNQLYELVRQVH